MARKSSKQAHEITEQLTVGPARRAGARESLAVLLFAAAMFLFICLVSYDFRDPSFNVATTTILCGQSWGLNRVPHSRCSGTGIWRNITGRPSGPAHFVFKAYFAGPRSFEVG